MFFSVKKIIINNEKCPITLTPIQDLLRENPANVVVFHHPQKKICFAYDREALRHWFYTSSKNALLQGDPQFAQIILQDLLSQLSLDALILKKSNPFFWFIVDENIVNTFEFTSSIIISVLPLLIFLLFIQKQHLNSPSISTKINTEDNSVYAKHIVGSVIMFALLNFGLALTKMTNHYAIPKLRAIARKQAELIHISKEELFEKNFEVWFEKNYFQFNPARHQLSIESVQIELKMNKPAHG